MRLIFKNKKGHRALLEDKSVLVRQNRPKKAIDLTKKVLRVNLDNKYQKQGHEAIVLGQKLI